MLQIEEAQRKHFSGSYIIKIHILIGFWDGSEESMILNLDYH